MTTQEIEIEKIKARGVVKEFYEQVCEEAEKTIAQTHTLEGAHYAAMKTVLKRWGVEL